MVLMGALKLLSGADFGKRKVPNMGNGAGDDFGKSSQEDRESTTLFLGDGSGKTKNAEYRNRFSPGFSGLLG